jgi:hypothetical protein
MQPAAESRERQIVSRVRECCIVAAKTSVAKQRLVDVVSHMARAEQDIWGKMLHRVQKWMGM